MEKEDQNCNKEKSCNCKCGGCGCTIMRAVLFNLFYIYSWIHNQSLMHIICLICLVHLLRKACRDIFKYNEEKGECLHKGKDNSFIESMVKYIHKFKDFASKSEGSTLVPLIIILFLLAKIIRFIPDRIILFIVLNICILYKPLNKKFPNTVNFDKWCTCVRQTYEGVFDLIGAFIPKFSEKPEKEAEKEIRKSSMG